LADGFSADPGKDVGLEPAQNSIRVVFSPLPQLLEMPLTRDTFETVFVVLRGLVALR
jgi:hypothetical protein